MARVVILGAGMMGAAFSWPLVDRGHEVTLVGTHLDREIVDSIQRTRIHPKLGLGIPESVRALQLEELAEALSMAEAVVLGVSSAGVAWAGKQLAPLLKAELPIAMISKGLAWDGKKLRTLPDVFLDELPAELAATIHPVAVAGPCIAGELARRVPTAVVFAARELSACDAFAALSRGPYYYVWTRSDVTAVEICAGLKNAYAMGIALAQGVHAAAGGEPGSIALHNVESAVFAQSIWEMKKLIRLHGGDPKEADWLPGVGDLDVTTNGGRTGRFGFWLGQGIGPEQAILRMQGATLECLEILGVLRAALQSYTERGLLGPSALPLAEHLAAIALDGAPVDLPFSRFFAD